MRPRARDVAVGRLPRPDDDSGNIAMLLLVIIIGATVGSLVLAIIINQLSATRFTASRSRSLDAAQAGVAVMLGQLRAATDGNPDSLPCSEVTGAANASGTSTPMTYRVSVSYYSSDPAQGAAAMTCVEHHGTFDATTSAANTPRYAKITSTGLESSNPNSTSKGRTITTTYALRTYGGNIPGGQIQLLKTSGSTWCMDGGATPGVHTAVVLRACSTTLPPQPQQIWAYRIDLSIQLMSSVTTAQSTGLCLDTSPTAHAVGNAVVLNTCKPIGTAAYNQRWSSDENGALRGAKSDGSDTDNYCITAPSQTALQALTLTGCTGGAADAAQTWIPGTTTGAGMAGSANSQIVNAQKFATCLNVTDKDPNAAYLVLRTCTQNPNPLIVGWNQKFTPALGPTSATALPQTGKLTTNNGTAYCLQSPSTSGGYVTVSQTCTTTWTWNQTKDAKGAALPYAQVYTIVDGAGRCLAPGPSNDLSDGQYFKIVVAACDGSTAQKWNADPSVLASRLTNTGEK